jgi:hypothetical protein
LAIFGLLPWKPDGQARGGQLCGGVREQPADGPSATVVGADVARGLLVFTFVFRVSRVNKLRGNFGRGGSLGQRPPPAFAVDSIVRV